MTDIVERLRMTANCGIPDFTNSKLLDEAADEIERLRAMDWREIAQRMWDGDYASVDELAQAMAAALNIHLT